MRFYVDGEPLDTFDGESGLIVHEATAAAGTAPDIEDHDFSIPGRLGQRYVPGASFGAAPYGLSLVAVGQSHAEALQLIDWALAKFSQRHRLVELRREELGIARVAWVKRSGSVKTEGLSMGNHDLRIPLPLSIPAGRWFEPWETVEALSAGISTASQFLGASAPMDPIISFPAIGSTTDVRITDVTTGDWVRFAGDIPAGALITIDPIAPRAWRVDGTDVTSLLSWGPDVMHLSPEALVEIVQNGTQEVTIRARRAWLA